MRKLGGGYGFTKIDLADAYNQVRLGPESRKRLALSTHRGVCCKTFFLLEFHQLQVTSKRSWMTSDLPGVAVFLDDILISGNNVKYHYHNLQRLLHRLHDKGLRYKREKCSFAQPQVEYLGHMLQMDGIHKGHKVDAILNIPAPSDVTSLKSFFRFGSVLRQVSTSKLCNRS